PGPKARPPLAAASGGGPSRGRGPLLTQEVFLEPIGTEVIFAAPRALRREARAPEITLDDMGAITVPSPAARLHYRVESELETPPPAAGLRWEGRVPPAAPAAARYLEPPPPRPSPRAPARGARAAAPPGKRRVASPIISRGSTATPWRWGGSPRCRR